MIDLQECRKEIDVIDKEIMSLFEKRMKVCEDVAKYKIHTGKKVLDPKREKDRTESSAKGRHMENSILWVCRNFFSRSWLSAARDSISFLPVMALKKRETTKW